MRETQYVRGLELSFSDPLSMKEWVDNFALKFNTKVTWKGKDEELHKSKARLFELKGGPSICWCEDKQKKGYNGDVFITIPYIIVDGVKKKVPEVMFTDSRALFDSEGYLTGSVESKINSEVMFESFVRQYWRGNPTPIVVKKKKVAKSAEGLFPKVLSDLVATTIVFYAVGGNTAILKDNKAPDYIMSVILVKMAADGLKETERYYSFLDNVRAKSEEIALEGMEYLEAVELIKTQYPKVYEFFCEHNYLLKTEENCG
jgi:hypothetical protein